MTPSETRDRLAEFLHLIALQVLQAEQSLRYNDWTEVGALLDDIKYLHERAKSFHADLVDFSDTTL